jgi:DNA polymerase
MSTNVVYGKGPIPSPILLCGEAPGREEMLRGEPFVGRSGEEQEWYLSRHGLSTRGWYKTNVSKDFVEGNPDPTRAQLDHWTPHLIEEIKTVSPKLIVAVGRFAMRWLLGESATLDACHGLPHYGGAFDPSRAHRANGAIVIPVQHPASGFYSGDARALIDWDYAQVAAAVKKIRAGKEREIQVATDTLAGHEHYLDIGGDDLATYLSIDSPDLLAIDTEGSPDAPWSIQVSTAAGTAYVLRRSRPDFASGISYLQAITDRGATIVLHNAMWDMEVCRALGLELRRARIFDTMYAAYLLRVEPQGLKPLARRWCGMEMSKFDAVVAQASSARQLDYLAQVIVLGAPPERPQAPQKPQKPELVLADIPKADRKAAKAVAAAAWQQAKDTYQSAKADWKVECDLPLYSYGRWGRPAEQIQTNNAGESRVYRPQGLYLRAVALLNADLGIYDRAAGRCPHRSNIAAAAATAEIGRAHV